MSLNTSKIHNTLSLLYNGQVLLKLSLKEIYPTFINSKIHNITQSQLGEML